MPPCPWRWARASRSGSTASPESGPYRTPPTTGCRHTAIASAVRRCSARPNLSDARSRHPNVLSRPPGLPAPRAFRAAFAAAYALAYLVGGERRMLRLIRRYGPIMTMPILSLGNVAIVSDPELVKQVFTAPPDVLLGGEGVGPAAAIYGSGSMFVQEEPEHLRRRKLLTPPLHGAALSSYVPIMEDSAHAALRSWPVDRPFQMLEAARSLMLD